MNVCKIIFSIIAISLLISCSDNATIEKSEDNIVIVKDTLAKAQPRLSKDNKPNMPVSREDSLKMLTYVQLQSYMPQVPGYKKGLTGGETLSNATSGGRQSYARQEYDSKKGKLIIEIVDYSLAPQSLKDLMTMYRKNAGIKDFGLLLKEERVKEANMAFSEINKTDNYASIRVNIADKYLININGNNSTNVSFLKRIAETINLNELKKEKI